MIFDFKFPDVGEGVHEGKLLQLKFNKGDVVSAGDILAVVETDKVVAEIPSPKDGILDKYGAEEGQVINVGETLAWLEIEGEEEAGEKVGDTGKKKAEKRVEKDDEEKTSPGEERAGVVGELETAKGAVLPASGEGVLDSSPEAVSLVSGKSRILATPVARKLAADLNIDLSQIHGSGPGGRVMKDDVYEAADRLKGKRPPAEPETAGREKPIYPGDASPRAETREKTSATEIIPLTTLRKTITENMENSQRIPVAIIQDYNTIDDLVEFRERINADREDRISFQPIFIKALAAAIRQFPILNSTYNPENQEISVHKTVNVGIAVDTDAGLMVPVIKSVQKKSIVEINSEMRELVKKAQDRTIQLEDLRGGTISITNYGPFGGVYGKPMILPPQVAILGFGRIHQAPVVRDGNVVPAWVFPVSLPFDHRVVDGATASSFVTYYLNILNSPGKLLLAL